MTIREYRDLVFNIALEQGCTAAEIYFCEDESFSVGAREGELDEYSVSKDFGLNLRVEYGGRNGYAYTEALEDADALVRKAMDNARTVETDDMCPMQGASEYEECAPRDNPLSDMSAKEKIDMALELERRTLERDSRVTQVQGAYVMTGTNRVCIYNTRGLEAEKRGRSSLAYVAPIMADGDAVKNSFAFRVGKECLNLDGMVDEAIEDAAMQFGAKPVPTGVYNIILRNSAMADLVAAFSPMFSADNAQKGLSLLANREGEVVASAAVTLVDDPFHEEYPRAFDAEGVPSFTKTLIDGGVFKTLLYNLKTAAKAGVASTSNASRSSASSPIGTSPTVMYLKAGELSYDELVAKLGDGIVITDISGLHAGVDEVAGEFSVLSRGRLVEGGVETRSVEQITIGGSFLELLKAVVAVGTDMRFSLPSGSSMVGSPSVLIEGVMVSGE
ncbi:MAG: TldD/PmbA family protein [Clostridia bacterium]|nr:TldD/PmbA family protein [Clostridia bacterium]